MANREWNPKSFFRHLTPDATVVFRHDAHDSLDLPALPRTDLRAYGGMAVEFLARRVTPPADSDKIITTP